MSENEIKPVTRYELDTDGEGYSFGDAIPICREHPEGEWVAYAEHCQAIDCLTAERDAAVAGRDALSTLLAVAGGRLEEAANEIEGWGAYADEYFQKKHRLAEVVQSFRDDAKDAADAARSEGGV